MILHGFIRMTLLLGTVGLVAGCGNGLFGWGAPDQIPATQPTGALSANDPPQESLWDLFSNSDDPNVTVNVNKYIWNASLDILSFLPVESVDPFTGVIVMGYGTPPGGGRSYRATVYIQDPALDARSLNVALQARGGGAVSVETARAVEDAILTRARQLRVQDSRL